MSKFKGGLGKGLSALIRPASGEEDAAAQERSPGGQAQPSPAAMPDSTRSIPIASIRPNPFQPRADFDQQALDELKESIRQKGIIQAVTVRRAGEGSYELISGERRIRALQELGMPTVPAYILKVGSDQEMLELALIENLQREHLNPIEIAISYQRLVQDVGLSAEDVARKVSKDRTTVVNFLRLLKLPPGIQDALRKGDLTMGHARALVSVSDERMQIRLFEQIVRKDLNVRQVERLVRNAGKKSQKKPSSRQRPAGSAVDDIAQRMQQILATRVKVNLRDGDKGEILIEFYSTDDLGRLFDLISSLEH